MAIQKHQIDMTNGPLLKKIILFTIPIMLTSFLQVLYNAADIVVVGNFSPNGEGAIALAAVGPTSSLINLVINGFISLSMGAGVVVAQAVGARNKNKIQRTVHTAILLGIILGFAVLVVGFFCSKTFLSWMGMPDDVPEVIEKAELYMKIYFLGAPAILLYNFSASILRSVGDSKRPLFILSISGLINVILNIIFVVCFGMSVEGVALATTIAQYISAVWVLLILIKDNADYKLYIKKIRFYAKELREIIVIGVPMGIQASLFNISNVIIHSAINSLNNTVLVAGNSAASSVESFIYVATTSFAHAAVTFAGQNTGAGKFERVRKTAFLCCGLSIVLGVIFGFIVLIFKEPLISLYNSEPAVIAMGARRITIMSLFYGLCGTMDVIAYASRGMGKSIVPMFLTLIFACVIRVLCVYTVFEAYKMVEIVYWSYPVTWFMATIAQYCYFNYINRSMAKKFKRVNE